MGCQGSRPVQEPETKADVLEADTFAAAAGRPVLLHHQEPMLKAEAFLAHAVVADTLTTGQPALAELTAEERVFAHLWEIFNTIDRDDDDSVSKSELIASLALDEQAWLGALIKEAGLNMRYTVLGSLNTGKDGRVTWDEFHLNLKSLKTAPVVEVRANVLAHLRLIFDGTDVNIDGTASKKELAVALVNDEVIENLINEAGFNYTYDILDPVDTVIEGRITWEEFEAHLRSEENADTMLTL